MRPLTRADIIDIAAYELERSVFRPRIIELKKRRRIQVGELVTLVFENRETMRFQIQEMMRAERIVVEERIQEEIDTYNPLIPEQDTLSATLLIEITDQARLRELLDLFIGINHGGTTFLVIGGGTDSEERIEAEFEGGHSKENRVSAVHYVRFRLTADQAQSLAFGEASAAFEIAHPNYRAIAPIPDRVRESLAADLLEA